AFRAEALVLLAGGSVLAAVLVTAFVPPVPRTRTTLVVAGLLSGTFGTAVGIGGPPLALVYAGSRGPEIRGTLGMIMLTGLPIGIGSLALSGHLGLGEIVAGLTLWPAIAIGYLLARRVQANAESWIRPLVLSVSAFGAVVAITRTLVVA
ncbi:MAG: sulfite exporter TauE/SafE family protein, partial [Actinomycetota bacterium]|nr:sulfite exporter TauE/SafE family protein [Actinomycetota bacterium]